VASSSAFKGNALIELKTMFPAVNALSKVNEKKLSCYIMICVVSVDST